MGCTRLAVVDWPLAALVWGFAIFFVGFHHFGLMRNRQLLESGTGDADLVTTTHGDLWRLTAWVLIGVLLLLGLRTLLGHGLAFGVPVAGALFASGFAAFIYWLYADVAFFGRPGGGTDVVQVSDEQLGCLQLVFALALSFISLVFIAVMLITP